jgi:predicted DsbA family dithiol-disulfide isomerase
MSETLFNNIRTNDRVSAMAALHVEVIADLVCPFCFIGKRRFDLALKSVQGPREVSWYPYQLNPDMPEGGQSLDVFLTKRFGSPEIVEPVLHHLTAEGQDVGINFRFDQLRHVPNTLPLHQLMQLCEMLGKNSSALADDLFSAFFEKGRNIGDRDVLIDIAATHGISAKEVVKATESDQIRQLVLTRDGQARGSGLAGVPGFLVNRRLMIVGAQNTDTMVNAFDRALFGEGTDSLLSPALH